MYDTSKTKRNSKIFWALGMVHSLEARWQELTTVQQFSKTRQVKILPQDLPHKPVKFPVIFWTWSPTVIFPFYICCTFCLLFCLTHCQILYSLMYFPVNPMPQRCHFEQESCIVWHFFWGKKGMKCLWNPENISTLFLKINKLLIDRRTGES